MIRMIYGHLTTHGVVCRLLADVLSAVSTESRHRFLRLHRNMSNPEYPVLDFLVVGLCNENVFRSTA
jgi:hypothetical protein